MKVIKIATYEFEELSGDSKKRAIANYRDNDYSFDFDCETTEVKGMLETLGFDNVNISYDLSCSQGSGACFDFKGLDIVKLITPLESDSIFYTLQKDFLEVNKVLLKSVARAKDILDISTSTVNHHYCHSKSRIVNIDANYNNCNIYKAIENIRFNFEDALGAFYISLCDELYKYLSDINDSYSSDEYIIENIKDNDITFLANGKVF